MAEVKKEINEQGFKILVRKDGEIFYIVAKGFKVYK